MQTYRIFVQQREGGFGAMRTVELDSDGAAVDFAQTLLNRHAAVDIWNAERRVAFMSAPPDAQRKQR